LIVPGKKKYRQKDTGGATFHRRTKFSIKLAAIHANKRMIPVNLWLWQKPRGLSVHGFTRLRMVFLPKDTQAGDT